MEQNQSAVNLLKISPEIMIMEDERKKSIFELTMFDMTHTRNHASGEERYRSAWHDPDVGIIQNYISVAWALTNLQCSMQGSDTKTLPHIALLRTGRDTFVAEQGREDGSTIIFQGSLNGMVFGAKVDTAGNHLMLPPIPSNGRYDYETTAMVLVLIALVVISDTDDFGSWEAFQERVKYASREDCTQLSFKLSDALYYGLLDNDKPIKCSMPGGVIPLLTPSMATQWSDGGELLAGEPKIFKRKEESNHVASAKTFGEAKKLFASWVEKENHSWTDEEKKFIPTFEEDFPIPEETVFFCNRYVHSHDHKRPMLNFLWRGTTSYGKSTGVELMAALLNRPLLRMTCRSTMETMDFLSEILPNETPLLHDLPTFEEISYFPEEAYHRLTGEERETVTCEEAFQAYTEAVANRNGSGSLYKHVKSNFVRALENGYIVEVQEISRIKDPGVLVGLNEFDRPGALIPLSDGTFTKRHPDAIVVYTDNVGYASCRSIDPSVVRRMDVVKDSFELTKEQVVNRVIYNTGFADKVLLEDMYEIWKSIQDFCEANDITEGSVSVTELERWAQSVIMDDYTNIRGNCEDCVIHKATAVQEEQQEIYNAMLARFKN